MFKIWRSKQISSFCGTIVHLGRYLGEQHPDKICPNCGQQEMANHLMICPDTDRTRLFMDQTDQLSKWLDKDNNTEPELAYWLPKYILMRGNKPFSEMGDMSNKMRELAQSQDKIGWRKFMEGCISTKLYEHQIFYLWMLSSRLNATNWTKQIMLNILKISHSQWIYWNILFHNQTHGYLNKKNTEQMAEEIHCIAKLEPEDVPEESRFLLEMNLVELMELTCWDTGILEHSSHSGKTGKAIQSTMGAREKRSRKKHISKTSIRIKLGIVEVER